MSMCHQTKLEHEQFTFYANQADASKFQIGIVLSLTNFMCDGVFISIKEIINLRYNENSCCGTDIYDKLVRCLFQKLQTKANVWRFSNSYFNERLILNSQWS